MKDYTQFKTFNEVAQEQVLLKYGYNMPEDFFEKFNNLQEVDEYFKNLVKETN